MKHVQAIEHYEKACEVMKICHEDLHFYYIIVQTHDVELHSRRHPVNTNAGTQPFIINDVVIKFYASKYRGSRNWRCARSCEVLCKLGHRLIQ